MLLNLPAHLQKKDDRSGYEWLSGRRAECLNRVLPC